MKLYLVKGKSSTVNWSEESLYVIADDAGQAESFAKKTWEEWGYLQRPYSTQLLGERTQYPSANGVLSLLIGYNKCSGTSGVSGTVSPVKH